MSKYPSWKWDLAHKALSRAEGMGISLKGCGGKYIAEQVISRVLASDDADTAKYVAEEILNKYQTPEAQVSLEREAHIERWGSEPA